MLARLLSFWVAASATWVGNRIYTFNHQHLTNMVIQWLKHMLTAHVAGSLNLMIFWSLKDTLPLPLAFCLGIIVSLFANYYFSKKLVFTHNSESKAKEKLNKVSRRLN